MVNKIVSIIDKILVYVYFLGIEIISSLAMHYPNTRSRRLRNRKWSRELFAETKIASGDLIQPFFISEGNNVENKVTSMPGVFIYSIDNLLKKIPELITLGIKAILIFPQIIKEKKSNNAEEAYNPNNLICRAIRAIKKRKFNIGIMADVALDPYTLNGHDGVTDENLEVLNDKTLDILCKQSIALAESGCDIIAPSDMMDGRVGKIRLALENIGCHNTKIMSYSVKYASQFYGPFRNAVNSASYLHNSSKSSYQMDLRNSREAITEVQLDINEGTDAVIIKPGMPYLDIISLIRRKFNIPIIGYQVSGEYSMIKFAAQNGVFDNDQIFVESLISFKRAGACAIITYAATEIAKKLGK